MIRDTNTLGTLREMLVLIRLWGQTTPAVLPSITPSAGMFSSPNSDKLPKVSLLSYSDVSGHIMRMNDLINPNKERLDFTKYAAKYGLDYSVEFYVK